MPKTIISYKNYPWVGVVVLLLLRSFSSLYAQETAWNRIAKPGYQVYAPVTLANGVYGITMSEKALIGNQVQLNGVFDIFPGKMVESSLAAIDFTHLELIVMEPDQAETERADFLKGKSLSTANLNELQDWQQEFNFRQGWLTTSFTFEGLEVEHTLYALKHMIQTGVIKMTVKARQDKFFSIKNILSVSHPYQFDQSKYLHQLRERKIPLFTVSAHSPTGKYLSATTSSFFFPGEQAPAIQFVDDDKNQPYLGFEKMLRKGESITFYLIGSMATTETYTDPISETARLNIYTYLTGPEKVISQHIDRWESFWQKTDIVIEGQPEINKDIRQMMFMLNSFVNGQTEFSTACMGLGNDYWGWKALWDADFWIYPALLLINPEASRAMLEYRWERLEQAKQNAAAHGYRGAMFPWESGASGEEQTSLLYLTGPFQHHITSDVGLAFWRYFCVTQDQEWLQIRGYPLLKEVAEFWVSRVEQNEAGDYEIRNVVGSDEFAINVDNDAFTNGGAIQVLKAADQAARILDREPDPKWLEVADKLVIRIFPDGTVKEHDTYQGETIKQADVNLIGFPLDVITDKKIVHQNLDYYESRITPSGPNMSYAMFAGAAARSGDGQKALRLFEKALIPYKKGPFKILSLRTQGTSTYFGTSAGGLLQAFILGFGGLHFTADGLVQKDPCLPPGWGGIIFKGIGNDQQFEVKQ
ncbi:MAG: glycoside hydrolase family 65 protein [Candidatus Cyclobacteriaceae bacterium M3_2C_046]